MRALKFMMVGALLVGLAGCASLLEPIFGPPSAGQARTVAEAEIAYTATANLEVVWLKSGKATKAQAAIAKALDAAVYADVVAGRTAIANNESAAAGVAVELFNQAIGKLRSYIAAPAAVATGGAGV